MTTPANKPIEPVKAWAVITDGDPHIYAASTYGHKPKPEANEQIIPVLITPLTQSHAEEKKVLIGNVGSWSAYALEKEVQPMKILTSGTTVSEGDKFTHVEWEVYEKTEKEYLKWRDNAINLSVKIDHLKHENKELQAQNERMREALKEIEKKGYVNNGGLAVHIAREALTSPPSESIKEGEREEDK